MKPDERRVRLIVCLLGILLVIWLGFLMARLCLAGFRK